ncbi:sulfotransferase family [Aureococcus anophagefferens]|nr:sulfotransferase family [Aureococcus anophagefferens]
MRPAATLVLLAVAFHCGASATNGSLALCGEAGCWPATWVLGGRKCGSTSVFEWVASRGVCVATAADGAPRWKRKETHFWNDHKVAAAPGAAAAFAGLYPRDERCSRGFVEATPRNLHDARAPASAPALLRAALPEVFAAALRFVAVLREPVARDFSDFNHVVRKATPGAEESTYERHAACRLDRLGSGARYDRRDRCDRASARGFDNDLAIGFYAEQLERWFAAFGPTRVFVVELAWLSAHFDDAEPRLASFLRLPAEGRRRASQLKRRNKASRKCGDSCQRAMSCDIRDRLAAAYAPWNDRLYALLAATPRPDEEPPLARFAAAPCVADGDAPRFDPTTSTTHFPARA